MADNITATFEIKYRQYLNHLGEVTSTLPDFAKDKEELVKMYQMMHLVRMFDQKAVALQRTGKLGTYPPIIGQEAIGIGIGAAMAQSDIFCPYYRDIATQFWRGVKMEEILMMWGGSEYGNRYVDPAVGSDLPISVPIASQTLHAVGAATAIKYRNEKRAVVTTLGEGGTSRGDFYEAMNVAGVWNLPVVFVVNNNQWAISVPRDKQTGSKTFAQKAIAAGIYCEQVDGNDVIVSRQAMHEALARAYDGQGPTVIEMISYRMGDHTTADDATRYRSNDELEANKQYDPIARLKVLLAKEHKWTESDEEAIADDCANKVSYAVEQYLNEPKRPAEDIFNFLYETMPEAYSEQLNEACYYDRTNNSD